jgi:hypothetical protein
MNHMTADQFGLIPEGMKWCPHCNGYGSSLKEASGRCTHCGGSGLVSREREGPVAPGNGEPGPPRKRHTLFGTAGGRDGNLPRQWQAGDTRGQAPGMKWCAVNAIAEYADYGRRYTRRGNQVQRSFEDTHLKQRGLELATQSERIAWTIPLRASGGSDPADKPLLATRGKSSLRSAGTNCTLTECPGKLGSSTRNTWASASAEAVARSGAATTGAGTLRAPSAGRPPRLCLNARPASASASSVTATIAISTPFESPFPHPP